MVLWIATLAAAAFFFYKWQRSRYSWRVLKSNQVSAVATTTAPKSPGDGANVPLTIPTVPLEEFDPVFRIDRFGPTLDAEVYFLSRGNYPVPGGTSDLEAWVLSALAKTRRSLFEFGTCTGKTAYLMARNALEDATVTTLTLSEQLIPLYKRSADDSDSAVDFALRESVFKTFLYTDTPVDDKVVQLFGDSKGFDESAYERSMDLIFVDGSHAYSYIRNDTEKALRMVRPGGIVLWHDYQEDEPAVRDVVHFLNELSHRLPLRRLEGTTLVAYQCED
jgi:hypothetical protein